MKILVVDDHRTVADAFAARLRMEDDVDAVATATTAHAALAEVDRMRPDVAVVDAELGPEDGIDLIRQIHRLSPRVECIVVTAHDDVSTATAAVRAGAAGFVAKDAPGEELLEAIRGALHGETHIPPRLLSGVFESLLETTGELEIEDERIARLTPREREVLEHMVAGHDRATIAREMFVSINTVRTHAKNILAKLEVHSTLEAVHVALRAGIRPTVDLR